MLGLGALGANAAVVDLSPVSGMLAPSLSVPELTISTTASGANIGVAQTVIDGQSQEIFCAIGEFCNNDFTIDFTQPSDTVSIMVGDIQPPSPTNLTDLVTISAFDIFDILLGSISVTTADVFGTTPDTNGIYSFMADLSAFSGVSRLEFDDESSSESGGFFYFAVDASPTPIPLPATLPLIVLGLGGLGLLRLRRRKST
ncbi:hypothetical protein [uncultured Tateyamaria sp.]|uniref:hypothetical protein n=1 Tax=uncultured Tateyamaria sp. TaxID=455651 RepID=UPI0026082DEB|nr:hypothetical protein [uncultured Tateyamaria sp.]